MTIQRRVGRIAARFSHLRNDKALGIVGTARVEQDRGRLALQIDQLQRATAYLTFEQEDTVEEFLHQPIS